MLQDDLSLKTEVQNERCASQERARFKPRKRLTDKERAADETRDLFFKFQLLDSEMLENRVDSALST